VAGAEAANGAAPGGTRAARGHVGSAVIGLAVIAGAVARLTPASAQDQGGGADFGPPTATQPANPSVPPWVIVPALSVSETLTDNANSTATMRKGDAYTALQPSLYINGEDAHLRGNFNYSPELLYYVAGTQPDQVQQNLLADGTLTAVQDFLFVDANATISNLSRVGGVGYGGIAQTPTNQIPSSQATQTTGYTLSPYARFHFADTATGELRYTLGQTIFSGNTGNVVSPTTGQNLGSLSNLTQQDIRGTLNSGATFARLQFTGVSEVTFVDSPGSGLDSTSIVDRIDGQYAITPNPIWYALFGAGYESQTYSQQPEDNFVGPTWDAGIRVQPRADRQLTVTYGEVTGHRTVQGNVTWALGGQTNFVASYSVQNSTQQQQILQSLGTSLALPTGVTINQQTGLPQNISNPNLALQNGIFVVKSAQAGLTTQVGLRGSVAATVNRVEQDSLTAGALGQTTTGGTISYSRTLTPLLSGVVSAGYAVTSSTGTTTVGTTPAPSVSTNSQNLTLGVNLSYQLSETLSASGGYALSRQTGGGTGTILDDIVVATLHKSF
jgi:uncharacterized protein (PEP-CTERM system associated)